MGVLIGLIWAGGGLAAAGVMAAQAPDAQAAATGQATPANAAKDLTGTWQGTLHAGHDLRTVVKITKDDKGAYKAEFFSIDQGGQPLPVDCEDGAQFDRRKVRRQTERRRKNHRW
jgi:hypothetical protein